MNPAQMRPFPPRRTNKAQTHQRDSLLAVPLVKFLNKLRTVQN